MNNIVVIAVKVVDATSLFLGYGRYVLIKSP